jgi:hypothetical protein
MSSRQTRQEKICEREYAREKLKELLSKDPLIHVVYVSGGHDAAGYWGKMRMYSISQEARLSRLIADALEMRYDRSADAVPIMYSTCAETWTRMGTLLASMSSVAEIRFKMM